MGTLNQTFNPGCLECVVGTMYSGKSKELIERGLRATKYGDVRAYYFKPSIDTRDEKITSRNGLKTEAYIVKKGKDIIKSLEGARPGVVIIDEGQFFDESLLYAVQILKKKNFNVVVGGLDKDFRGQPFQIISQLMALSDSAIRKIYPVCSVPGCVEDGSLPQRLRNGRPDSALSPTVVIEGSTDEVEYRPVCREHHRVPDLEEYLEQKLLNSIANY